MFDVPFFALLLWRLESGQLQLGGLQLLSFDEVQWHASCLIPLQYLSQLQTPIG